MTEEEFRQETLRLLTAIAIELEAICKRLGGIHGDDATPEGNGKMSPLGEEFRP